MVKLHQMVAMDKFSSSGLAYFIFIFYFPFEYMISSTNLIICLPSNLGIQL